MIVGITFHYQPPIGWHDVLVTHIIPRASSFLSFIMVLRTCAHVEVCAKRKVASDGCSFGNPRCHAWESRKGLNSIRLFPVVSSVFHSRARERVTVTTRETTLKQLLVVNHHFISIATGIVAPKTALGVFSPKANATLTGARKTRPRTVHRNNPYASINTIGCPKCPFSRIHGITHAIRKIAGGIVKHHICRLFIVLTKKSFYVAVCQRTVRGVNCNMEIVETLLLCNLIQILVKRDYLAIAIVTRFPIIVDTIET